MGYTHYWKNTDTIDDSTWEAITTAAQKIIDESEVRLAWEHDEPSRAVEINATTIRFNGVGEDGHETFLITRDAEEFGFCKTAQKPYDEVVVAMLQLCAVYAPGFSWTSDGDRPEHDDGVKLYNRATGANWDYSNVTPRD